MIACKIIWWFLARTESGVSPFCVCGFVVVVLGVAGKRIKKEGKRVMYICIAKMLCYEL